MNSDLNRLILDYLVIEGHKTAAEHFSSEANLPSPVDLDSIESRVSIREALQRGDVENAIMLLNDLDPEASIPFIPFPFSGLYLHAPRSDLKGRCGYPYHQNFSLQYDLIL
jgi:hypothetical protein